MNNLYSLTVDTNGHIYIVDRYNAAIRKVDSATGEPGYSGDVGLGTLAQMREPNDCFLDGNVGLLIADIQDHGIGRLNLDTEIMATSAGDGEKRREGDGKPATEASLMGPGRFVWTAKATPTPPRERATGSERAMPTA